MRTPTALAITLLAAGSVAQEATLTIPAEPPGGTAYQRVKRLLPPHVGCAVMVLGKDADGERVEFKRGYGVRALSNSPADGLRVTPTTTFRVSSFTKVLTAAAVLRLVEEGALSLSDSLSKWVPGMAGTTELITLAAMLEHTSGLPAYHQKIQEGRIQDCSDLVVLRAVTKGRLDFPPGTQCSYSNSAYVILGLVVQQASGRQFHEYLRDEVLVPLGMKSSVLLVEGLNEASERAYGHETKPSPASAVRQQLQNAERVRDQLVRAGGDRAAAFELQVAQMRERLAAMEAAETGEANWRPFDQGPFHSPRRRRGPLHVPRRPAGVVSIDRPASLAALRRVVRPVAPAPTGPRPTTVSPTQPGSAGMRVAGSSTSDSANSVTRTAGRRRASVRRSSGCPTAIGPSWC